MKYQTTFIYMDAITQHPVKSNKNSLQELFQKLELPLPTYNTQSQATAPHQWQSTVTLLINDKICAFTGDMIERKHMAESDAARVAINSITVKNLIDLKKQPLFSLDHIIIPNEPTKSKYTYVLIDYENTGKCDYLNKLDANTDQLTVIRFIGTLHPKASYGVANYIVDSTVKDAVDHYISFYIGALVSKIPKTTSLEIFVVTRDHFGASLSHIVSGFKNVTLKHCVDEQQCTDDLHELI